MNVIKEAREKAELTQEKLAKLCGVQRSTIAMIENGTNKPRPELEIKIAKALNLDWSEFHKQLYEELSKEVKINVSDS